MAASVQAPVPNNGAAARLVPAEGEFSFVCVLWKQIKVDYPAY